MASPGGAWRIVLPWRRHAEAPLLQFVERWGNRLPDPATLFLLAWLAVLGGSVVASGAGWSVPDPLHPGELVRPRNLLVGEELTWVLTSPVRNLLAFPPLGLVLVTVLGVGVAERVGLLAAALRAVVLRLPARLLVPGVVFAGVESSLAGDAGWVVLPPLASELFRRSGRAPLLGLACVVFGMGAGVSANLLPTPLDPLLSGLTEAAARTLDPAVVVAPTCNWWFKAGSTLWLVLVGWWVSERVVEPRLPVPELAPGDVEPLGVGERRGLLHAAVVGGLLAAGLGLLVAVEGAPLSGMVNTGTREAPAWSEALVPSLFVWFMAMALAYGRAAGTVRHGGHVTDAMTGAMQSMGGYIVLAFFAGQMIAAFQRSNLSLILAITGADALGALGVAPSALLSALVVVAAGFDIAVASASAKWAFLAPVVVPMFMRLGIAPEVTQAAYRVGDSVTNPIAPLNPYLMLMLVEMRRYDPQAGLGTLLAMMLPYSVLALVSWTGLLLVWVGLGLPLGV